MPEILKRWSASANYLGEDFSDYFIVTSFTRDSNVIEVANFIAIASYMMDIEPESERGWKIARFGHWACGYFYSILVHENSPLVKECEEIAKALRDYAVYDENILIECEEIIRQAIIEDEDEDAEMQMVIEAPAAYYCESLLKPYL
jgi:hypothetical protein